jgi:predicted transcriptional regulator of viral defense system
MMMNNVSCDVLICRTWYNETLIVQLNGEVQMLQDTIEFKTKSSMSRTRLSKLLREGGELLTVEKTALILGLDKDQAAKSLARWRSQGWLAHIKRGVYVAVPIEAETTDRALEDVWILIPELFDPAYVGGWSAAEHWDLTEQIFRDVCVFTARPVTKRHQTVHNITFVVAHSATDVHFGTKPVWKKGMKILVSDPTKTIVDILSNPWAGGGIQHMVDCLKQYFNSGFFKDTVLIDYATRLGNGAVFKRLGYLSSQLLGDNHPLTTECLSHLTAGKAQLDPALPGDKLITRWRLFIPANLQISAERE